MRNLKILVDVDGVLADLHAEWCRRMRHQTDVDIHPEAITRWDQHEDWSEEEQRIWWEILSEPDLYDHVEPIEGSGPDVVDAMRQYGEVTFVTACESPEMVEGKMGWLRRHGYLTHPWWGHEVIVARRKYLVRGDVIIDDYHENLRNFAGRKWLYSQPYNKDIHNYSRVDSLSDALYRLGINWRWYA